jgi:hypothetical protein
MSITGVSLSHARAVIVAVDPEALVLIVTVGGVKSHAW